MEVFADVGCGDVGHRPEKFRRLPGGQCSAEILLRAKDTELLEFMVGVM